ncbi:MAG: lysophospholipid acyltransferase family protein [Capsulimonadaceae bacterium]
MAVEEIKKSTEPVETEKSSTAWSIVPPPGGMNPTYYWLRWCCIAAAHSLGRLEIRGRENIPKTGPVILASNHRAHVDPPYLSTITNRQILFMAKEELFTTSKRFGTLLYNLGAFPVRRGESDRAALRHAIAILKQGQLLGIFPEGTRSFDETLLPPEKGFALIAKQTGAPIVPVAMEGTQNILPKGTSKIRRGPVSITIGPPVTAQQILDAHEGEIGKDALDIIGRGVMARIDGLMRNRRQA